MCYEMEVGFIANVSVDPISILRGFPHLHCIYQLQFFIHQKITVDNFELRSDLLAELNLGQAKFQGYSNYVS